MKRELLTAEVAENAADNAEKNLGQQRLAREIPSTAQTLPFV
jgi:hypothetical protein